MSKFNIGDSVVLLWVEGTMGSRSCFHNKPGVVASSTSSDVLIKFSNTNSFIYKYTDLINYDIKIISLVDNREEHFDKLFNN